MVRRTRLPTVVAILVAACLSFGIACRDDRLTAPEAAPLASLAVTPAAAYASVGDTVRFVASGADATGRTVPLTSVHWQVSSNTVALIGSDGLVTAHSVGETSVIATSESFAAVGSLSVGATQAAKIELIPAQVTLTPGESVQFSAIVRDTHDSTLTGTPVYWQTTDPTRGSIDQSGQMSALAPGPVGVVALVGGATGTAAVLVNAASIAPVVVDSSVIGGAGLVLRTAGDAHARLNGYRGSVSLSTELPQLVFVVDTDDRVRGIAISNVVDHTVTVQTIDAGSTALALLFASPHIGSLAPGATDSIFRRLSGLPSFTTLRTFLSDLLPAKTIDEIVLDPTIGSLMRQVASEYSSTNSAPVASLMASNAFDDGCRSFFVTRTFPTIREARDVFENTAFRVVSVWQRDLDGSGNERDVRPRLFAMKGVASLSLGGLIDSAVNALFGNGNTTARTVIVTQTSDVAESPPALSELWIIGMGTNQGVPLPASITPAEYDNIVQTLYSYYIEPAMTFLSAGLAAGQLDELQRIAVEGGRSLAEVKHVADALASGNVADISYAFNNAVWAIVKLIQGSVSGQTALEKALGAVVVDLKLIISGSQLLASAVDLIGEDHYCRLEVNAASDVISVRSGNGQSVAAGNVLLNPIKVAVRRNGTGVQGAEVYFSTPDGGRFVQTSTPPFTIAGNPARTDVNGYAQVYWLLGPKAGAQVGTASVAWVGGSPIRLSAIATAQGGATLADLVPQGITVTPNPATAGAAITVSYTILNSGGTNAASTQTKVQIKSSAGAVLTQPTFSSGPIAAYGSVSESRSIVLAGSTAGTYTATVIVDNLRQLNQSNTANDYSQPVSFTVLSGAMPTPLIASVVPSAYPASTNSQTMTINGSNFQSGAKLLFDPPTGADIPSTASKLTFVNSGQIVYEFNNNDEVGAWAVRVTNPNGQSSAAFNFTVTAGVSTPAISSVSPNPVPGLNGNQTLTVTGSGFVSGAIVRLRDLTNGGTFDKTPTSLSGTQLQISANFTAAAATWSAQVINLDGGTSGQFNFTVTAGVSTPAISSVSPNPVPGLNGNQTLTVTGSGFVSGAIVRLRDLTNGGTFDKTPTSLSGTQLQISANFTAAAATWSAQVINLDGGTSGQFNFTVTAGVSTPAISSVSPNPVPGLNGNQTLTVTGSGFVSGAIVRLRDLTNGGTFDKTPTSLSGTQLQISANFTAAAATWSAQVINLDGGTSGQFNFTVTAGVSTPAISSVSPNPVPGLNGNQTLTVTGSGFVSGAIVRLRDLTNGGTFDKTPTSLSGTQLQISANFTAAAATWSAQVINLDGGTSGQFNFTVTAGVSTPAISSVSPNPVPGLNGNQTLTVTGSGFVSGAIVRLRDLTNGGTFDKTPTSLSGTQLQISANFTAAAATWSAQVINLDGGTSGQFNFTVTAGVSTPAISSVSPNPVPGLNGNQTLTVTGSGFVSGAIVRLRDLTNGGTFDKTPTSLSGTQLQISANFTAAAATWSAQVINLDGGTSGQFNFTVTAGVSTPAISSVSPNPVPGLNGNQTLTVTGSGFVSGAIVRLRDLTNGGTFDKTPTSLSGTQLQISANFTAAAATWSAQVINLDGGTSGQFNFTVTAGVSTPAISSVSPNPVPGLNGNQTLTVTGSGFVSGAIVRLRDLTNGGTFDKTPTSLSGSQLQISANFTAAAATWSAQVINLDGGTSGQFNFTVTAGVSTPAISSVSPNPVPGLNGNQTLTVTGSGFVSGAIVRLRDLTNGGTFDKTPTSLSGTQLQISANFTTAAATWSAQVINLDGGTSGQFNFTVTAGVSTPAISSVSPNPVPGLNGNQTLTVTGSLVESLEVPGLAGAESVVFNRCPTSTLAHWRPAKAERPPRVPPRCAGPSPRRSPLPRAGPRRRAPAARTSSEAARTRVAGPGPGRGVRAADPDAGCVAWETKRPQGRGRADLGAPLPGLPDRADRAPADDGVAVRRMPGRGTGRRARHHALGPERRAGAVTEGACPFCDVAADRCFYQGERVVGLWDAFPVSDGHALLVTRRHVASWFEATAEERQELLEAVDAAKAAIEASHTPDGYNIGINIGRAAGQTIFHLHVHVIPRYTGDVPDPRGGVRHVIPDRANYLAARDSRPAGGELPHRRPLVGARATIELAHPAMSGEAVPPLLGSGTTRRSRWSRPGAGGVRARCRTSRYSEGTPCPGRSMNWCRRRCNCLGRIGPGLRAPCLPAFRVICRPKLRHQANLRERAPA